MTPHTFLDIAFSLDDAGLMWIPEIGDEVSDRRRKEMVSILVNPHGLSPDELRAQYLWLPNVEQMVTQLEIRQAVLFHAGLEVNESSLFYKAIVQSSQKHIETRAQTLRLAVGTALRDLLLADKNYEFH